MQQRLAPRGRALGLYGLLVKAIDHFAFDAHEFKIKTFITQTIEQTEIDTYQCMINVIKDERISIKNPTDRLIPGLTTVINLLEDVKNNMEEQYNA